MVMSTSGSCNKLTLFALTRKWCLNDEEAQAAPEAKKVNASDEADAEVEGVESDKLAPVEELNADDGAEGAESDKLNAVDEPNAENDFEAILCAAPSPLGFLPSCFPMVLQKWLASPKNLLFGFTKSSRLFTCCTDISET